MKEPVCCVAFSKAVDAQLLHYDSSGWYFYLPGTGPTRTEAIKHPLFECPWCLGGIEEPSD